MNITKQAQRAYAPNQMPIQTPRSVEAKLFSKVTARMNRALGTSTKFAEIAAVLHENRQMWTTLATAVADKDNRLPATLRAQIFYLAEFTELHSRKVLRNEADLSALVDINAAVMRGLNGSEV